MRNLRVAVWQFEPRRGDVEANLARLREVLSDREVARCDVLVAPEMFLTGFTPDARRLAAPERGGLLDKVGKVVADGGVALATSILTDRAGSQFNVFYLWDSEGNLLGHQDKIHLWAEEANRATPGDGTRPMLTEWGQVGGMVCYDVEFPEVSRTLAVEGAELLLVPAAFYSPTGWDIATKARALENGCYLAAANHIGGDPARPHNGMSRIVDPFGSVLCEVPPGREGVVSATLDGNMILKARQAAPFLRDRRLGVAPPGTTLPLRPKPA